MLVELHTAATICSGALQPLPMGPWAITRLGLAKEWVRAQWLALRGVITRDELDSRLRAYRAIWNM